VAEKKTRPAIPNDDLRQRLWRARNFIDECYDQPIGLTEISKQACLSRYHFLRSFREAFDTTPRQYLIHRRIEKAKELLRKRTTSVTEICFEVGFQSLGSFSTLFHKCVGDAPVNYRRRQRAALKQIHGCFISMYGLKPSDRRHL
jgi:AraC-like DNA-binding protein